MKTNYELIKSLKIGDTFYYVGYTSINISDIFEQRVVELSANFINDFKCGKVSPDKFVCRASDFFLTNSYQDVLQKLAENAQNKIARLLDNIRTTCKEIAICEAAITMCNEKVKEIQACQELSTKEPGATT